MLASILIIAISLVLLAYWFRYSCLLLLREHGIRTAQRIAPDNSLSVSQVQELLKAGATLDPLHTALQRDYRVLKYLLRHANTLGASSLEDRLLVTDYVLMEFCYRLTRTVAPERARQALSEMANVLAFLSGRIGAQAGLRPEA